ncbi:hypothetical protein A3L11_00045 [Thermococcus siculi]|uniref:Uncharacterized protein n=1 Tax=Thermococcus siculi TaxID=72803 RepID=A0A2Z2MM57_9EURY|nr:hypothetical protein [Thermococcus siculi]ASJ07707.1 hypothetical protein A3L11_00045 [Thermococcus siculi]
MRKVYTILALLLVVVVLASGCENPDANVKTEKTLTINDITVHYSGDVSLGQAKDTIGFVQDTFQITGQTDVYLSKSGDAYTVKVTTPYGSSADIDGRTAFYVRVMASKMAQDVFDGSHVYLKLLNGDGKEIFSAESRYAYVSGSGINVWYADVGKDKAQTLLDYAVSLAGSGPWDLFLEGGNPMKVKAMSSFESPSEIGDAEGTYRQMASDLSEKLGGSVQVIVLNPEGEEIASFEG